jgi:hypothetical protein
LLTSFLLDLIFPLLVGIGGYVWAARTVSTQPRRSYEGLALIVP